MRSKAIALAALTIALMAAAGCEINIANEDSSEDVQQMIADGTLTNSTQDAEGQAVQR